MIRRLICLLLLATVLSACEKAHTPPQPQGTAPQTVLMYLPWSGNLYQNFLNNIEDAKQAVKGNILGSSRLLVFLQPSAREGRLTELYCDRGDCRERLLKTYSEIDVTQPATIARILRDVQDLAPAEHYGMTVGSHGMAWIPDERGRVAILTTPGTEQAAAPREKEYWEYAPDGSPVTRWFGSSESFPRTDTEQFAAGIEASGIHFDFILFDVCFMSSIEVAYDLRTVTDCLIGSPFEIISYGFPYATVMPRIFSSGGTVCDLEGVCRSFYEFYTQYREPYNCGAVAVTVCSELPRLAEIVRRINAACPVYTPDPAHPLQRCEYIYTPTRFYDLGDYIRVLCDDAQLLAEFEQQLARTLPERYRFHTEHFYSSGQRPIDTFSGISTSDPSTSAFVTPYLSGTAWYRATHE